MLDDIAAVGDDAGDEDLPRGEFDAPPSPPLVFMARVCGFKRNGLGVHLKHETDDILQSDIEDARTFVDTIAGVITDLLRGDATQRVVERLDVNLRVSDSLRDGQRRICPIKPG